MRNAKLMTGVALAALLAGAPGAFATDVGNIDQDAVATNGVTNAGVITVMDLDGKGSSASISATGALASVSVTGINAGPDDISGDADVGLATFPTAVDQRAIIDTGDDVDVTNDGAAGANSQVGEIAGRGASVSISATGAVSAVSARYISSTGNANFGDVIQITRNKGAGDVINDGRDVQSGSVTGDGASLNISATGAASSVSLSGNDSNPNAKQSVASVDQTTTVSSGTDVTNVGRVRNMGGVNGDGASFSVSATGAASSVSIVQIDSFGTAPFFEIGDVTQTTTKDGGETGAVTNSGGTNSASLGGGVTGDGASASVSATGAVSAVSATYIKSDGRSRTDVGDVDQDTFNSATVSNTGIMTNGGINTNAPGDISGDGASISISATGAASAVSATFINSDELRRVSVDSVTQRTENQADVTNTQDAHFSGDPANPNVANLNLGEISGDRASASLSATGAASSVGLASINNKGLSGTPSIDVGNVEQTTINSGAIVNQGQDSDGMVGVGNNVITTGEISGTAASVSISATGAISAVSIASVNGQQGLGGSTVGNIAQSTTNSGSVTNSGTINAGSLTNAGTSASISATGAGAAASFSSIE